MVPSQLPLSTELPLIGREAVLDEGLALLKLPSVRLLTLTGFGGVGKTRLATEMAAMLEGASDFPDGIYFVDLSPLSEARLVLPSVQAKLAIPETEDQPVLATLESILKGKRLLLILDNFEQVIDAATDVAHLLAAVPGITILATSREPLRLRLEQVLPIEPLALPETASATDLGNVPSVALFVDRARAARPNFQITSDNAEQIARLVARLDGLPLAIELMARRAAQLGVSTVLNRLESNQSVAESASVDAPGRHRSLSDAIAWSHDLLTEDERRLFSSLGAFAGRFTLEAVEAVTSEAPAPDGTGRDVLTPLLSLSDKSLIIPSSGAGDQPAFRMLETVRQFAVRKLEAAPEPARVRERHAAFYVGLAERAAIGLQGHEQRAWLERLDFELDNLRAALRWLIDAGDAARALELSSHLGYYWWISGRLGEGCHSIEHALNVNAAESAPFYTGAMLWCAILAHGQGDHEVAEQRAHQILRVANEKDEPATVAIAHTLLGLVAWRRGDTDAAIALHEKALALAEPLGDQWTTGDLLFHLGLAQSDVDLNAARSTLRTSLEILRKLGGLHQLLLVEAALAGVEIKLGNREEARALLAEGLGMIDRGVDPISGAGLATCALAFLSQSGYAAQAAPLLLRLRAFTDSIGYKFTPLEEAVHREALAGIETPVEGAGAITTGEVSPVVDIMGATAALFDRWITTVSEDPAKDRRAQRKSILSAREAEVLQLVAQGMSNRKIADQLVVSENTAKFHVASLLTKLDASTRAEAVSRAAALGLLP